MSNTYETIQIVCGVDSNYAPHLAVMLSSVAIANPGQKIQIHIIHDGVDALLRARVESCTGDAKIIWYEIKNHPVLGFYGFLQISRAAYLRLAMNDILPLSVKRVLYLDVDLIVNTGLQSLWNIDLGDKVCGAVMDPGVDPDAFADKWSLPKPGRYMNTGVILIDLDKLRARPFLQNAIALIADPTKSFEYADQDALNIVLWNDWLPVDPAWNFQRKFMYNNFSAWNALSPVKQKAPHIIHYTERQKPWQNSEWHPYAWLYLRSLFRTPFRKEVMRAGKINIIDCCKWWLRLTFKRPAIFQ